MAVATAGPVPPNRADLPPHHTGLAVDLVMATGGGGKEVGEDTQKDVAASEVTDNVINSGKAEGP